MTKTPVKLNNNYFVAKNNGQEVRLFVKSATLYSGTRGKTVSLVFSVGLHQREALHAVFKSPNVVMLMSVVEALTSTVTGEVELTPQGYDCIFSVEGNEFQTYGALEGKKPSVSPKLLGFSEAKRRIIEALDNRIDFLTEQHTKVREVEFLLSNDLTSRKNELQFLRKYIKGMVIKVDE